jgi:hypothetical protein
MEKVVSQESLSCFDSLYLGVISRLFNRMEDSRAENASYSMSDALKSGFAIYSLKCASLFSFRKRSQAEDSNLATVYGIGRIPTDNALRNILDKAKPDKLRQGFHDLFKRVRKIGVLDSYRYWNRHLIVSMDGVEHFCSKTINCKHCLQRSHRDGSTSFYHAMLSAAIVHPDKKEVFVLDNEPIVQQDGAAKNDCERNAAQRLFGHLQSLYSKQHMVFVCDALYSCAPVIRKLSAAARWEYIIAVKPEGHKSLFGQFEDRVERGQAEWHTIEDEHGEHRFSYANDLALNDSNADVRVNMLYYEWIGNDGKVQVFSWVTSIKLTKANVYKVMRMGRSRWKIENETFNTLKNQSYNFEHNFGHGQENLCTIFAYLMMLAFYVDQIQQSSCRYFRIVLRELKTRAKLWESIQAVFKILPRENMAQVLLSVAEMYQINLE